MGRLAGFSLLYMTAVLLELAERWRHPVATVAGLALVLVILRLGLTRVGFLVFLAATTGYFLLVQFPEVANHVNIMLYSNLLLMAGLGWSLRRRADFPTDDDGFELVRPVLQLSLILVYALAGFAKLNTDFLDSGVSCVGMLMGNLRGVALSRVAGVPTLIPLAMGVGAVGYRLFSESVRRRFARPGLAAGAIALALAAVAFGLHRAPGLPQPLLAQAVLGMALLIILWELVLGPLLAVPALQAPILAFSWSMHATLALIGFVDFGALALALLLTFVPRDYADRTALPVRLPGLGRLVQRVHLYFAICLLAGAYSALGRRLMAGIVFNLAALVLLWPILAAAASPARPAWRGVPLRSPRTPGWLMAFPVLLLLHGLTSYLGLRTAGNFTMFSNLRTEGERSNHLLLRNNPLKLWHYQEDVVRVTRIDDEQAKIGHQYQPLEGNRLPVVEFRKLVEAWSRAGRTVPIGFEHAGVRYDTEDIAHDPVWHSTGWDWEMRLLDFRVIQEQGPNRCRW